MSEKEKCSICGKLATWILMSYSEEFETVIDGKYAKVKSKDFGFFPFYCDKCVPRGCTCQEDPNEPCCEYMYDEEGFEKYE